MAWSDEQRVVSGSSSKWFWRPCLMTPLRETAAAPCWGIWSSFPKTVQGPFHRSLTSWLLCQAISLEA